MRFLRRHPLMASPLLLLPLCVQAQGGLLPSWDDLNARDPVLWLGLACVAGGLGLGGLLALFFHQRQRLQRRREELRRLRQERARLRAFLNAVPDPMFSKNALGAYEGCNPAFESAVGRSEAELLGRRDDEAGVCVEWTRERDRQLSWYQRPDGERQCLDVVQVDIVDGEDFLGRMAIGRDVTELQLAREKARRAETVFAHCGEGILVCDGELRVLDLNPALCRICGYEREELLGEVPQLWRDGEQDPEQLLALHAQVEQQGQWSGELLVRHKSGDPVPVWATVVRVAPDVGQGEGVQYLSVLTDISRIKATEAELLHQSLHDRLTGLPNSALMRDRIEREIGQAQRTQGKVAV
ncbi:MAG TPA: PAS domain S-box protein, partial [Burkholderiaceae bacterium]|nr:PAS domain S-box protein [Burkholderiaceae bacterium]